MAILITLNTGDITYNDMTYNIDKCNITYTFPIYCYNLSHFYVKSVISIVITSKLFISIVVVPPAPHLC